MTNLLTNFSDQQYPVKQEDLQWIEELGTGASGQVVKYKHLATGKMIAVKVTILILSNVQKFLTFFYLLGKITTNFLEYISKISD